jgi:choline kinase
MKFFINVLVFSMSISAFAHKPEISKVTIVELDSLNQTISAQRESLLENCKMNSRIVFSKTSEKSKAVLSLTLTNEKTQQSKNILISEGDQYADAGSYESYQNTKGDDVSLFLEYVGSQLVVKSISIYSSDSTSMTCE